MGNVDDIEQRLVNERNAASLLRDCKNNDASH